LKSVFKENVYSEMAMSTQMRERASRFPSDSPSLLYSPQTWLNILRNVFTLEMSTIIYGKACRALSHNIWDIAPISPLSTERATLREE